MESISINGNNKQLNAIIKVNTFTAFTLRSGNNASGMNDIVFNGNSQVVTCNLDKIEKVHLVYVNAKRDKELIDRKIKRRRYRIE